MELSWYFETWLWSQGPPPAESEDEPRTKRGHQEVSLVVALDSWKEVWILKEAVNLQECKFPSEML